MPIYEYQCEECERKTEAIQRLDDPPLTLCPHCGGPLKKLMSAPAFQFKGTGWYVTDYADENKRGSGGDGEPSKSDSGDTETSTGKDDSSSKDSSSGDSNSKDSSRKDSNPKKESSSSSGS